MSEYKEINPFTGKEIDEDAPVNVTGPSVAGTGDDNTVHTMRKKKKKTLYDGRTKVARKFIERILKQREARLKALTKEEVVKEESLTEKVDKKLALKILSMMKNQKFKKIPGDFVPQIYLSGMDKDKLKKEFGRLPRGLPSASSGVPVVDFINYAMGISKTVDGIDTEDGDKPQPKLYDYRSGKVLGKPRTVGDAAKMAGLRLENVELSEGDIKKTQVKRIGHDFNIFYKGNTKYGRNKMIGYFVFDKGNFEVYHDNSDRQNDFQQIDMVKTAQQALDLIFDTANSNGVIKENVELDEVVSAKDKKVIDDFVQMNKGTGAQNFTQRGNIVDYEGKSLEKSGMGAQQIASLETDGNKHKIKVHAKMDGRSTQSIVNYLKKSANKYNVKVEETDLEEMPYYRKIYDKIHQMTHPKGYEKIMKMYVDLHKQGHRNPAQAVGQQVSGVEARDVAYYINGLIKKGKLPSALAAEVEPKKFTEKVKEQIENFGKEYELVENNLKILQNIVKKKQNQNVRLDNKNVKVDLYTASAIMNVYNAVNKDNKKKMERMMNGNLNQFLKLQGAAFKLNKG